MTESETINAYLKNHKGLIIQLRISLEFLINYNRPPLEIRNQLDLGYRIEGQSIYLFEIRPRWDKPKEKTEPMIAKTTYIKSKDHWKIYWMRGNLKWYPYDPDLFVKSISDFFDIVEADKHHCFFG